MVMATRVYIVVCPRLALPWRPGHFSLSLSFYDRLSFVDGGIILTADAAQIKRLLKMLCQRNEDARHIRRRMLHGVMDSIL